MKTSKENPRAVTKRRKDVKNGGEKRGDPLVARRVREGRERVGISQTRLAADIGRGRSTITNIESEGRPAGRETLVRLAKRFNVPVDYFTSRNELMAQAMWVLGRMTEAELKEWVDVLTRRATSDKLPPRD